MSSAINIIGLSIAIGCSIVAFLFMDFHYHQDTFHENINRIFLIQNVISGKSGEELWGDSPLPLGPALKSDFPQIERVVRIALGDGTVKIGNDVFHERIHYVDEGFLQMFTFPLKYGEKDSLSEIDAVFLSEDQAKKYFGNKNPVGERILFVFHGNKKESYFVKGVAEKIPSNASFTFDILLPFEQNPDLADGDFNDWDIHILATFIQFKDPSDIRLVESQGDHYIGLQNAANPERKVTDFLFEPLTVMAQNSYRVRGDISFIDVYPGQILSLFFGGLFLLLLACFNYMNISVVSATKRLKEIGVRKVIGSHRSHLIWQFLGENLLLCFFSLLAGVVLAHFFFVPGFTSLFHVFDFEIDLFGNLRLWIFLIGLLILTGIGAGAYPAFYISSFQPANIFRGKLKLRGKSRFTKVLLTFQFILSFINIVNGVVFIQNNKYQRQRDWGYNKEQVLVVPLSNGDQFTELKNTLLQSPNVVKISGTRHHVGLSSARAGVEILAEQYEVARFDVGFDYIETMRLRPKAGRAFDRQMGLDIAQAVLVNEKFVEMMEWQDSLGKRILYDNIRYYVIGVLENFHYRNFMNEIEPAFLRLVDEDAYNFLIVLTQPGKALVASDYLKASWKTLFPDSPYRGFFQDDISEEYMQAMAGVAKSSSFTSIVALLITCMGIFGLVALTITRRKKEISIRKVLGATHTNIANLINKGFFRLVFVAAVLGCPASYYLIKTLLDSLWRYHKELDIFPFVIAFGLILFSSMLTISYQVYRAVVANPADALRTE
jgi:ABC-type antimicrobial peptide transport system permease subunit